ncbi:MAG: fibronectin type III domain-containing protein [Planctomycetaceae bacterium]|nr:fibronectin type III domain-containing protein [Planctomycetaceae bacterium]
MHSGVIAASSVPQYHVFIVAGQSNAVGYTGGRTLGVNGYDVACPTPDPNTAFYWDEANGQVRDITETSLTPKDSFSNPDNILTRSADGGWQNKFAIDYASLTGKKVIIIDAAFSGSGVISGIDYETTGGATDNWPDDGLDDLLVAQWNNFKAYAASHGVMYEFHGILWCQGESERRDLTSGVTTQSQYEDGLADLFVGFNTNLSADLAPGATLVNVILPAPRLLNGGTPNEWSGAQIVRYSVGGPAETLIDGAYRNTVATLSFSRLVYAESRYFARDSYNLLWDGVHWKQSGYNLAGAAIAAELVTPGSMLAAPAAPSNVAVQNNSPWRNTISWTNPGGAGNARTGYTEMRIHRSTSSGFIPSASNLVGATRTTEHTAWIDATSLAPNTTYYYKVVAWNPGASTASSEASVLTESLGAIPAAFNTVASPSDPGTIQTLWTALVSGGHDNGLISLVPTKNTLNQGTPTTLYNVVRPAVGSTLHDFLTSGSMAYDGGTGFLAFDGVNDKAASPSTGVLPRTGPFTLLFAVQLTSTGRVFAHQPGSGTTRLRLIDLLDGGVRFSADDQSGSSMTAPDVAGSMQTVACVYDPNDSAGSFHYYVDSSTPASTFNGLPRKFQVRDLAALTLGQDTNPAFFVNMQMAAVCVWNRALSGSEFMSVRSILDAQLGLGL